MGDERCGERVGLIQKNHYFSSMNKIVPALFIILILSACNQDCEKVVPHHEDGIKEFLLYYPDCSDTTTYTKSVYFENGQLGSKGNVVNGLQEGHYESWNKEGTKTASWHMKEGLEHGQVSCWHDNGVKAKEVKIEDGLPVGVEKVWNEEGELEATGEYQNGLREGKWWIQTQNKGWKIRRYKKDILNGSTIEHNIDSLGNHLLVAGQYVAGLEQGVWKIFYADSVIKSKCNYKDGKINGHVTFYDTDGKVQIEANMFDGNFDGKYELYDSTGMMYDVYEFENGKRIK